MKIETHGNKIFIYSPYNSEFITKIKKIGGARWNPDESCWMAPLNMIDTVRCILREVYGEDDLHSSEKIGLRLTFLKSMSEERSGIEMFGKSIAKAYGRDSGARVGNDCAFEVGSPVSGGSTKHWMTTIPEGCVVLIHNVSKPIYDKRIGSILEDGNVKVEVLDEAPVSRVDELKAERARLLKRLDEIDKLLEGK